MRNQKLEQSKGFTLVEAAIIITAISVLIAPFFAYLAKEYKKEKLVKDERVNEQITAALAAYVAEYDRYPCPADWTIGPDTVGAPYAFGAEVRSGGTVSNTGNCDVPGANINADSGGNIYFGALPTQTLKLPASASVNAYGWKYLYAVSQTLADADVGSSDIAGPGSIVVEIDVNDNGLLSNGAVPEPTPDTPLDVAMIGGVNVSDVRMRGVHFVVVNPGKDGKGSVPIGGAGGVPPFPCEDPLLADVAGDFENCDFTVEMTAAGVNPIHFHDRKKSEGPVANNIYRPQYYDDTLIYTLAREESTFWEVDGTPNATGVTNITTRADGNVGIGVPTPAAKLHVVGGSLQVNGNNGGTDSLTVDGNLSADRDLGVGISGGGAGNSVNAGGMIGAGTAFYYCDDTNADPSDNCNAPLAP